MFVKVLEAGLFSTIQDLGRFGYAKYGVPKSGAMDAYAAKISNMLVGNPKESAVIEFTLMGPTLKFSDSAFIAVSGWEVLFLLNEEPIAINTAIKVNKDDILQLKQVKRGVRAYVAISGGFQTKKVLGSRSFYQGITSEATLKKGDELLCKTSSLKNTNENATVKVNYKSYEDVSLTTFPGPEYELLTAKEKTKLELNTFSVSKDNSRMAYQLNETFSNTLKEILTQPVLPGTVQLTPSGKLIVLMRDCQTTGGYPRVLQLTEEAISKLSQKRMNDKVAFELIRDIQEY